MPLHDNTISNSRPTSVKVYWKKFGNCKLYSHNETKNSMKPPRQIHALKDKLNSSTERSNKCMKIKVYQYSRKLIVESLKEENWNMHLRNQELQTQVNTATADASKLAAENTRLLAQTTSLATAVETLKLKNAELSSSVAESKAKHEAEMSTLRRSQAGLQRDRSDLQRYVDELKQELSKRPEAFLDNLDEQVEGDNLDEEEESITP